MKSSKSVYDGRRIGGPSKSTWNVVPAFNEDEELTEIPSFTEFASRTAQGSQTSIVSKGEDNEQNPATFKSITENIDTMPESTYIHTYWIDKPWYHRFRSVFLVSDNPKIHRAAYRSSVSVFIERSRHLSTFSCVIHPYGVFRWYWDILITVFILATLLIEPVRMTFFAKDLPKNAEHLKISITITVVFLLDIILNFRTGWVNRRNDTVSLDPAIIAKNYAKSYFIIDLLSTIPFDLVYITGDPNDLEFQKIVRLLDMLKLLRLPRVIQYMTRIQLAYRIQGIYVRLVNLITIAILLTHWLACLHYLAPDLVNEELELDDKKERSWLTKNELWNATQPEKYLMCLQRTLFLELLVGLGSETTRETEEILPNLISILCGVVCMAFFIAHISAILMSSGVPERKYTEIVNQVKEYLRFKQVPVALQDRVLLFYETRYQRNFFNETDILDSVSDVLRREIQLHNCRLLVETVPIFEGLPLSIIYAVVDRLQFQLYLPMDMIITIGTIGNSMYFIEHGMVSILAENGKALGHLRDGDFFGELALISSEKRIASVVATSECDIYQLDRQDFVEAIEGYPEIFNRILKVAQVRKQQGTHVSNLPDALPSATAAKSQKTLYSKRSNIAHVTPSGAYEEIPDTVGK